MTPTATPAIASIITERRVVQPQVSSSASYGGLNNAK